MSTALRPLSEIDADLTVAYASRRRAMERQSFAVPGGHTESLQQLAALNQTIATLIAEKQQVLNVAEGQGSLTFIPTMRGH